MPDDGTCPWGIRWWADRRGWLTGWVNELRPVPTDPAALKVWVAGLSRDEIMALAQQVVGGGFTGRLGALGELDSRSREIDLAPPPDEPSLLTLIIELRGSKPRIWRRLSLPGDLTLDVVHTLLQAAMRLAAELGLSSALASGAHAGRAGLEINVLITSAA